MIDTVILLIPEKDFKISNYDAFNPSARNLFEPPFYKLSKGYVSCINNPSKKEIKAGNYKPRLTLNKRILKGGFSIALKIEFSAPKMIFGNNFNELEESDFEELLQTLHNKLIEMSVVIDIQVLRRAEIVGIHFGKNIILKNTTANLVINTIGKLEVTKRLDNGTTDFRNNGQAIRFHTNNYELTFYDKMKDLEQAKISEKRSMEKDTQGMLNLFTKEEIIRNEVLRMELRLGKKKKLKEVLRQVGVNPKSTQFDSLFNKEIAKRCLLYFWNKFIEPSLNILVLCEDELTTIFHKLEAEGIKKAKVLQILGALGISKAHGIRTLKELLGKDVILWTRLKKQIALIENKDSYLYDVFNDVKQALIDMQTIKELKV
jgi:hypothetical protein